jgi:hypothetical protein
MQYHFAIFMEEATRRWKGNNLGSRVIRIIHWYGDPCSPSQSGLIVEPYWYDHNDGGGSHEQKLDFH